LVGPRGDPPKPRAERHPSKQRLDGNFARGDSGSGRNFFENTLRKTNLTRCLFCKKFCFDNKKTKRKAPRRGAYPPPRGPGAKVQPPGNKTKTGAPARISAGPPRSAEGSKPFLPETNWNQTLDAGWRTQRSEVLSREPAFPGWARPNRAWEEQYQGLGRIGRQVPTIFYRPRSRLGGTIPGEDAFEIKKAANWKKKD